jgi:hypothetical protein
MTKKFNPEQAAVVANLVFEVVKYIAPKIRDFVVKAIAGDDVEDHEVRKLIPEQYRVEVNDKIKTAQREAMGLPT